MAAKVSDMRFAHSAGLCGVDYAPDGGSIVTCGADGEVRLFKGLDDDDAVSHLVGDEALAVSVSATSFFVSAAGTNTVTHYAMDGASKGVVARFTADATALDASKDGLVLAAGSEDMTVKVVDVESFEVKEFTGHEAPVLAVALDTAKERKYVISSSCDGSLRVWNLLTSSSAYTINNILPKSNDVAASTTPAAISWHPDEGRFFAVPLKDAVKAYARDSWDASKAFKPDEGKMAADEHFSAVAFSPEGKYLVGATTKAQFFIWRFKDAKLMAELKTDRGYCVRKAVWSPNKAEVAFIDVEGYWGLLENLSFSPVEKKEDPEEEIVTIKSGQAVTMAEELNEDELAAALFEDDDDDDNENSFSIRQIKRDTGFLSDDDDNSNMSNPSLSGAGATKSVDDAASDIMPPPAAPMMMPAQPYEPEIQDPFQPGSTPVNLSSRFMVWNSVGIVRCFNTDDENSIEVEFHDSAVHHPLHISNVHGHTMADLSAEALVLGCEGGEEETGSRLHVHHFASSDQGGKEWSVEMPGNEEVMAVCSGKGWVAAATDKRQLRIYSTAGFQKEVLSLPGPIVALAGKGDLLMITVNLGMPLGINQSMSCTVFNIVTRKNHPMPIYQPLPLSPNSFLNWIGFSDEGTPCLMDSAGIVRLHHNGFGSSWLQICDTKSSAKGRSDNHFLIGVSEREHKLRSIFCKGAKYPQTVPRPTVVLVSFALPLCDPVTEKSLMEETFWKQELLSRALKGDLTEEAEEEREDVDKAQTEALIKLFALAVKSDHESRAIEVCKLMDTDAIQIAIKYASKQRRIGLANKLSQLACAIQDQEEADAAAAAAMTAGENTPPESQDMFAHDDDDMMDDDEEEEEVNPILAAKMKKQAAEGGRKTTSILKESQTESRNPFKKSSGLNSSGGAIRPGLVFDGMKAAAATKSPSQGFGSRVMPKGGAAGSDKKKKLQPGLLFMKKTPVAVAVGTSNIGKENTKGATPIKGFQLWLAENRDSLEGYTDTEISTNGLQQWKELTKEQKEPYKTPRVPKRKRVESNEEENTPTRKAVKTN